MLGENAIPQENAKPVMCDVLPCVCNRSLKENLYAGKLQIYLEADLLGGKRW